MPASLVPSKGCGCSGDSTPLKPSQVKQQLERNRVVMAQMLPLSDDDPIGGEEPVELPKKTGCEDCGQPERIIPGNQFCINLPDEDCNGIWLFASR